MLSLLRMDVFHARQGLLCLFLLSIKRMDVLKAMHLMQILLVFLRIEQKLVSERSTVFLCSKFYRSRKTELRRSLANFAHVLNVIEHQFRLLWHSHSTVTHVLHWRYLTGRVLQVVFIELIWREGCSFYKRRVAHWPLLWVVWYLFDHRRFSSDQ